jgi:hypothetical protein
VDGSLLVEGSVVRGKLARESVLPENNGRGNSIRSLFAVATPTPAAVYIVPVGKTFIVTDIVTNSDYHSGTVLIRIGVMNGGSLAVRTQIPSHSYNAQYAQPAHLTSFQAGIRFDSGETVGVYSPANNSSVTLSGYEF